MSKRLIFSILITALIIIILLSQISLNDLYTLLTTVDPIWSSFGAVDYILALLFRALRFKWLIHSKDVSLAELFRITVFHNLSIMVLPSKLGELSYPYFLHKISGVPYQVSAPVKARLKIWEPGNRIPGIIHLSSVEVLLSP